MPNYRVHAYVTVRIDEEIEAASPEEAAKEMYQSVLASGELPARFRAQHQEYADDYSDELLVDELVEKDGKLEVDYERSQSVRIVEDNRGGLIVTRLLPNKHKA